MAPRSKISKLPKAVKDWLDKALAENGFADYELLAADLKERGYDISKSAIHRYGQAFEYRLGALRMATEQAKAVVQASPDDEGSMSEALMRLVQDKLFKTLMECEPGPDKNIDLPKISKAVAELTRATVSQKKWQSEVKAKAAAAASAVSIKLHRGGISEDVIKQIEDEILGIAN